MTLLVIDTATVLLFGTLGMVVMAGAIGFFLYLNHKNTVKYQQQLQEIERTQQKLLLTASMQLQEEERQRIAADLHDDAGPLLATVRLYLNENLVNLDKNGQLQAIFNAKQIVDDTIQLIRNISHSLMPPTLKNFGLESAVTDLTQKIKQSGVINASSRFHDYKERLDPEKELLLFRIVQEIVNNILKHSDSGFIHITQNRKDDRFFLRIHHDGKGITQEMYDKMSTSAQGLGLKNIRSRLELLNGSIQFDIDTSHTYYKVTVDLPWRGNAAAPA
jgi:two-component system, NarL family, sensor kinase